MYPRALPLVVAVAVSLLAAQLSGLHMHVDAHGYAGSPHATHVHKSGAGTHDHGKETDVKAIDLGTVGSKHLFFLVAVVLTMTLLSSVVRRLTPIVARRMSPGRRLRWRPPLRAPPAPLYPTN